MQEPAAIPRQNFIGCSRRIIIPVPPLAGMIGSAAPQSFKIPVVPSKHVRSLLTTGSVILPLPVGGVTQTGLRPVVPSKPSRLPLQAAGKGSGPTVLPGCENRPRPVMSLVLSHISRRVAVMSVMVWLMLRAGTPAFSLNCETRRGRLGADDLHGAGLHRVEGQDRVGDRSREGRQ